ncbi:uncharacterized protein LOC123546133 isoform X3 [Mercenaria mercenaria]|uniref:uncharacterized protein LOC123546133 isoform X3 n=1 Tax=Mercenaria mercenaria TaxID=6596 RepID=UPI00234F80C8|nr:uncharacterized protein LOC123546133 isoform X3 [Mercenaria mercenaria]
MELEGLKRTMKVVEDMGVKTKLTTLWKKRGCEKVAKWTQSISNHLYFCAATSEGDGDLVEQKWLSVLNHITNKHEGHGEKFPSCTHGPIERDWIKEGSKAHKELQLLLGKKRLVTDIRKLSPVDQTSGLEAHHKIVCQFAPKFVSFSYAVMKQRINLAALHTCSNAGRAQAITRDGQLRYSLSYPKYKGGKHIVKPVMEECSYDYIDDLNTELIRLRKTYNSHRKAQDAAHKLYISPPPLSSGASHVLKSDAILAHRSRFSGQ